MKARVWIPRIPHKCKKSVLAKVSLAVTKKKQVGEKGLYLAYTFILLLIIEGTHSVSPNVSILFYQGTFLILKKELRT